MSDLNGNEVIDERTRWYGRMYSHATRYYRNGWHWFVEGVGLRDFLRDMEENKFTTYSDAFNFYLDIFDVVEDRKADMDGLVKEWGDVSASEADYYGDYVVPSGYVDFGG